MNMMNDDLPEEVCGKVHLFADDTIMYVTMRGEKDVASLQQDLDHLADWEEKWQMKFHPQNAVSSELPETSP